MERRLFWLMWISAHRTLDPASIDRAITPRSKAIIAVHIYGQPADMEAILAVGRRAGLHIGLEDCAQAAGARYRGRPSWQPRRYWSALA